MLVFVAIGNNQKINKSKAYFFDCVYDVFFYFYNFKCI